MKGNQSPYAFFQIGLGIFLYSNRRFSGFILSANFLLALKSLFLGAGVLLFGLLTIMLINRKREKL